MRIKKVAIFTPGALPVPAVRGGAVEQLITYIIEGNEINHRYNIDLYTINDPLLRGLHYKYTKIIRVNIPNKISIVRIIFSIIKRLKKYIFNIDSYSYIDKKISTKFKERYYDAVLIENNMSIYKLLMKKKTNEKFFFHLHNDFDNGDMDKTRNNTKYIVNTANKIFVVSNYLKRRLAILGAKNVQVVYNSINRDYFYKIKDSEEEAIRRKLNLKNSDFVFTYIGRLDYKKGINMFLKAAQDINASNIKFLVVGNEWDNRLNRIKIDKKLKKLSGRVIHVGYVNNIYINKILSVSNCVVIPTQIEEAFGIVGLEAMKKGIPIVASDSGALPEVLGHGGSIIIKKDKNFLNNLESAMIKIYSNASLRKKMKRYNLKRSQIFPQSVEQYFKQFNL